ncbi:MAG: hypothetical protein JXA03_10035 [Bacteroidales bacterium]|nr:hypothetical protein [Bacteroidales bacterium]
MLYAVPSKERRKNLNTSVYRHKFANCNPGNDLNIILNNTVYNCTNRGIYGNNWKNLGLENYVWGNKISQYGTIMFLDTELKVSETEGVKNPHSPQAW